MKYFKLLTLGRHTLVLLLAFELATSSAMPMNSQANEVSNLVALQPGSKVLADTLGWVPAPENLCGGYYQQPAIVSNYPNPLPANEQTTSITADQSAYFSQSGSSTLQGNVVLTQPGRKVTADVAHLYRNQQSGQWQIIDMDGNVHFWEAGKLVVAKKAHIDLEHKKTTLREVIYKIEREVKEKMLDGWGTASQVYRDSAGVLHLQQASYSTCPPTQRLWQIKAGQLDLNKEQGWGAARHSRLNMFNVPVLYFPYLTFPLDDRRKTGFLFPTFSFSSTNDLDLAIPFYWNIAPNYDATITPHIYSRRGLQYNLLFRYLTPQNMGDINFSFLPSDRVFEQFKNNAPQILKDVPFSKAYVDQLQKSSSNRGFFSYNNISVLNPHWSGLLNLNYVTDDYYFQDFGGTPDITTTDQLLNRGLLQYQGENWRFTGLLQAYETLHPYTDLSVQDQYSRVPELDLTGDFPSSKSGGLDYHLDSQLVRFDHKRDFNTGNPIITGTRFNLQPSVRWPLVRPEGYFIPELQLASTIYSLQNQLPYNPNTPNSISREIPIFDIDSGLFFDRDWQLLGQHAFRQTLEPRIYYLFVPTQNQNNIPEFDTTLPPLTVEQLFRPNRFVGVDRLGDANQVSLGVTSRLLDANTNEEKAHLSLAEAFYLHRQQVFDTSQGATDPTQQDYNSPLVGELGYNLSPRWSILSDVAWDINRHQMNNSNVNVTYTRNSRSIFSVGYVFSHDGDVIYPDEPDNSQNNLDRVNIAAALPLTERWSAVGNWNYNISHSHPQSYFYGLEYQSCCWALRFVASRIITAENPLGNSQFQTNYYVQFQLRGLGNIGNNDPSSLLTAIPGYQDLF